nr:ubiquitin-like domain-containing protein CIP73 [Ipomoea batatas]
MHGWSDDMAVANTAEELSNVDVPVGDSFASAHYCAAARVHRFSSRHGLRQFHFCCTTRPKIKIRKMLCLQTPTLRIDKPVGVGAVKEEVRLVTGVLAEHQRLIFRGNALRDDKQLSDMWKMVTLCI